MEDVNIVVATLNGLRDEFEQFIQSVSHCSDLTFNDLQAKLYDIETK